MMHRKDNEITLEKAVEYATLTGYVQYWAGAFHTAVIIRDMHGRWAATQNLTLAIKDYKENVPENLRSLINIDIGNLEKLMIDIQKGPKK